MEGEQHDSRKLPLNIKPTLHSKIASLTKQIDETKEDLLRERAERKELDTQRALEIREKRIKEGELEKEKKRVVELEQQVGEFQEKLDMTLDQVLFCKDDADDGWKNSRKFTQEIEKQKDMARSVEKANRELREELAKNLEPDPMKVEVMFEEQWSKEILQLKDYMETAEYMFIAEKFREAFRRIWQKRGDNPIARGTTLLEIERLLERIGQCPEVARLVARDERVLGWKQEALNKLSKIHNEINSSKTSSSAILQQEWMSIEFVMVGDCNNLVNSAMRRYEILQDNNNNHTSIMKP